MKGKIHATGMKRLAIFIACMLMCSMVNAQEDSTVKANVALAALQEQMPYMIPQGQYPGEWWDLAGALGADVENGTLTVDSSDEDFMAELKTHDDTCASLIQ